MDEIVLKVKFSEEINDIIHKGGIFLIFFTVLLYLYVIVYAANVYINKRTQDNLVDYYGAERLHNSHPFFST